MEAETKELKRMLRDLLERSPPGEDAPTNPTGKTYPLEPGLVDDLMDTSTNAFTLKNDVLQLFGDTATKAKFFLMKVGDSMQRSFVGSPGRRAPSRPAPVPRFHGFRPVP